MATLTRRELLGAGLIAVPAIWGLSACGSDDKGGSGRLDEIKSSGVLKVGLADERPYGYVQDGKPKGLVVEVILAAASGMGVKSIDPTVGSFDSLIPGLVAKKFDVIGAGTYIKPDRCKSVAFTNPMYQVGGAFIVKAGNPLDLHSLVSVAKNPKARIGSQRGSSQVQEMKDAKIPGDRTVLFTDQQQLLSALKADRIDAIYFPALQVASMLQTNPSDQYERADPYEQIKGPDGKPVYNYGAIPVNKQDEDIRKALDKGLKEIRDSGQLMKIFSKYGLTKEELPAADVTAADLCAG